MNASKYKCVRIFWKVFLILVQRKSMNKIMKKIL